MVDLVSPIRLFGADRSDYNKRYDDVQSFHEQYRVYVYIYIYIIE